MQIPSGAAMRVAAIYFSAFIVSSCAMNGAPLGDKPESHAQQSKTDFYCLGDDRRSYDDEKDEVDRHLLHTTSVGDLESETREKKPIDLRLRLKNFLKNFKDFTGGDKHPKPKLLIYLNGGLTTIGAGRGGRPPTSYPAWNGTAIFRPS